jgi:glutamine cyclotransferase
MSLAMSRSGEAEAPPISRTGLLVAGAALAVIFAVVAFVYLKGRPAPAPARLSPSQMQEKAVGAPNVPERLKVKILSTRPHDSGAYTQGLLLSGGSLYESTGLNGRSSLREVDPQTGTVKRRVEVPQQYFAEGLALSEDRLIQLTWQNGVAFVYEPATFKKTGELRYDGEGWGLCHDGQRLVMTDGSDLLLFRDPKTLAPRGEVHVTLAGEPVYQLNEVECVDGLVYANVWQTDDILRIDPRTGHVTAVIDASGLLTPQESEAAEVLNGIAWDPAKKTFLITGKLWPKMFEVEFVKL